MTTHPKFNARKRRRALWITVCVTALVGALLLFIRISLQTTGRRDTTELVIAGIGMVFGAVIVTVAILLYNNQRNRLRDFVAQARPGATIIPAFAEGPRGLSGMAPTTIVLAALDDHIEVWDGGRRPRGTVALTGADIRVQNVWTGSRAYPGICITNGVDSLPFVPHYSATVSLTDLERALRELGENPSDHMER